MALGTMWQR
jgi:hypothetical protein